MEKCYDIATPKLVRPCRCGGRRFVEPKMKIHKLRPCGCKCEGDGCNHQCCPGCRCCCHCGKTCCDRHPCGCK